jgi:hypothetical protein
VQLAAKTFLGKYQQDPRTFQREEIEENTMMMKFCRLPAFFFSTAVYALTFFSLAAASGAQSIPQQVEQNRREVQQVQRQVLELEGQQGARRGDTGERGPAGPSGPRGDKGDAGEKGSAVSLDHVTLGSGQAWFLNPEGKRIAFVGTTVEGGGIAQFFNSGGEMVAYIGIDAGQKGLLKILNNGRIVVNGDSVHDYAEVFDLATRQGVIPGTIMAVVGEGPGLGPSSTPYDPRVVGVVSGGGGLTHGMRIGSRADGSTDLPIAVAGQVYVRVCLEGGAVRPGDILVASSQDGVAMRAEDRMRAFGAVIGKALETFEGHEGIAEALVRMLVMTH